jgi:hypothetical protein
MDATIIQKLKDAIGKSNTIGIAVAQNPSIDEMGAALAFYLMLRSANKRVTIASPTDPIVEISSLVGIDKVQRHFGGDSGDLVVSFPYKEGEIEKVSYTLENNFLNIIVKASAQGLSFEEQDVSYSRGSGSIDLLIVVGAASLDLIGDVIDSQKLRDTSIINIDINPNNQGYGDVVVLNQQASSVSEHIGDIALTLGFAIQQDAAQNILSGIMYATQNFQSPQTSYLAFEIASLMMKQGALRASKQFAAPSSSTVNQAQSMTNGAQSEPMPSMKQPVTQSQQTGSVTQPQSVQQPFGPTGMQDKYDQVEKPEEKNEKPPLDWLSPKVYKGSSEV